MGTPSSAMTFSGSVRGPGGTASSRQTDPR
jgi:hypothetical protein